MLNLISLLILLISFLGIVVIIRRKIPVLVELLPQRKKRSFFEDALAKVKSNGLVEALAPETILQKVLSRVRVLTLKTESKTAEWLKDLRQKSIEKRKSFRDDYWNKLRGKK